MCGHDRTVCRGARSSGMSGRFTLLRVRGLYDSDVDLDETWSAVLDLCHELGPVTVRRSRFADKPALFLGRREFVHWEGLGRVDLRISAAGWRAHAAEFTADAAVARNT